MAEIKCLVYIEFIIEPEQNERHGVYKRGKELENITKGF
jgi:hypothetical protein